MARIRHLAITTDDPEAVAAFYVKAFDMKEISCFRLALAISPMAISTSPF